ncbi:Chaperone protein dnaJ 8, chloroplastic [Capsicum annuum]|uniref:Chaperone protein dnaJ 8, chloroplastic n=1 Tax=Capsicum annuum TaxID=4072 RepID=A0A1U8H4R3_CAPAN|nr:chaperone protein dnaJ 8, chloroplastic [Capsicum annuum]PHT79498.1 Chaperone protein dnaJ 8, chloroplastic [Capsicum annuum]
MAIAMGMLGNVGGCESASSSWIRLKKKKGENVRVGVSCVYSPSMRDPYKTLRIQPDASESDVRKAFRKLALQYHPDVCRGSNCDIQFNQINDAYDTVMSNLRGETKSAEIYEEYDDDESMRGVNDPDWDMWEEWMGWEGAGIRDYSSHINPYI